MVPETLSLVALLSLFGPFSDLELSYPPSPRIRDVIASLPQATTAYEQIASEATKLDTRTFDGADRFDRTVTIFRLLLYVDGRTETALLQMVDHAVQHKRTRTFAINPLAGLANFYGHGGKSALPMDDVIGRLDRYATMPDLFVNAMACKRGLLSHHKQRRH